MRINQKNLKIYSSQIMRDSKSLTRFLEDLEIHSMMVQLRIQSVLKNQKLLAEVEEVTQVEEAGMETTILTGQS
jgi:hypothetical protein